MMPQGGGSGGLGSLQRAQVLEAAVVLGSLGGTRPYKVGSERLESIPAEKAVEALSRSSAIWIGEHRDAADDHDLQAGILAAVSVAKSADNGGEGLVGVGLEAVRAEFQPALDAFVRGEVPTLEALREATQWDAHWPYPIDKYEATLDLCRVLGMPIIALGADSQAIDLVEKHGLAALDEAAWAKLGVPGGAPSLASFTATPKFHRYSDSVLSASYDRFSDGTTASPASTRQAAAPPHASFANYYCASQIWEESMAARATNWLTAGPDRTLIALCGAEHVSFGCGAAARCADRIDSKVTSIILNPTPETNSPIRSTKLSLQLEGGSDAPLADYVWFSPWTGSFV